MQETVVIDREKYIGGSDVPAIMGISPFKKRFDLLLEKAQLKENDFAGNEYTEYGNVLEPKIRDFLNEGKKKKYKEDKVIIDDLRYHSDGFDGTTTLEIKTTSQIHEEVNDYKIYLVQLLFGIQMHGKKKGVLAVYHRPEDFNEEFDPSRLQVFNIDIKDYKELVEDINSAIDQFRVDLAKLKENPFLTEQDLQPTDIVALTEIVTSYEAQLVAMKELESKCKKAKEELYQAMLSHNIKKWTTDNNVQVTLVLGTEPTMVKKFDEVSFKNDHPEMFDAYQKEEEKKGRAGYVKITLPKD